MSHGIYFCLPELYSDRAARARGRKSQYSGFSEELPCPFNLGGARISAADQRVLKGPLEAFAAFISISKAVRSVTKGGIAR